MRKGFCVLGLVLSSGGAQAAITYPTSLDLGPFETLASLVITAGAAVWAFRRAMRLIGVEMPMYDRDGFDPS